jgi:hypothetical protein
MLVVEAGRLIYPAQVEPVGQVVVEQEIRVQQQEPLAQPTEVEAVEAAAILESVSYQMLAVLGLSLLATKLLQQ